MEGKNMIYRPTPETDAEHAQFAMGGFTLDFCRKLERERDKAAEDATNYYAKIVDLEHELHKAQEIIDQYKEMLDMQTKLVVDLEIRLIKMEEKLK